MPLSNVDIGPIVRICQQHRRRVRYGVLGAAVSTRVGNLGAQPQRYASATATMLNAFFGGRCATASWVVGESGYPTGYGIPPNPVYDPRWSTAAPRHDDVRGFLDWLDTAATGWDKTLQSTCP
jgi:hypothetical protein